MGLFELPESRTTRQSDEGAVTKSKKRDKSNPSIKGGTGAYSNIANAIALVSTYLGKYADKYAILRDENDIVAYFDKAIAAGYCAIDTETSSLNPLECEIAGIPLFVEGEKPVYIPINHISYITGERLNNQAEESVIIRELRRAEKAGVKWLLHNAVFDVRVLKNTLKVHITPFWDTYLGAMLIDQVESHELKDLHIKYCNSEDTMSFTYSKLFGNIPFTKIPISTAYLYAAGDGPKTFDVFKYQQKVINRKNNPGFYNVLMDLEMPLTTVIADMEDTGIYANMDYVQELSVKYHAILKDREKDFYKALAKYEDAIDLYVKAHPKTPLSSPVNINSPDQLAILFYDIIGFISPDRKKPRGTGEDIVATFNSDVATALIKCREVTKLLSTYIDNLPAIIGKDGKIHCKFNQYGAATGRFSSSEPNMQNIPSHNTDIRKIYGAVEGYNLISCDFSQQEPRTLAHFSKDPELIKVYRDGKDIYAWIASSIYNVPYEDCREMKDGKLFPPGKKRRDGVKSIILGIMYGRGAKAIGEQLGISAQEAQKFVDLFYQKFPLVKKWIDTVIIEGKKTGYVETAWGRRRNLSDLMLDEYEFTLVKGVPADFDPLAFDDVAPISTEVPEDTKKYYLSILNAARGYKARNKIRAEARERGIIIKDNGGLIADAERQAVNSKIQGTSADMTKKAMILIAADERLKELGYRMLLQVHDEIIGEAPEEVAQECADRVSSIMVESARGIIDVPMKCDSTISKIWYEFEEAA